MKRSFAPSAFPQSAIGSLQRGFAAFGIRSLNPCSIRRLLAFAKTAIALWLWRRCSNSTVPATALSWTPTSRGFFANRSHQIILQNVAERVADGNILPLVEKFLTSGVMDNGVFKPTTIGTPQGGVVSPLLATIVLNHLDWQLDRVGLRFVRYADDFVVLTPTPEQAKR